MGKGKKKPAKVETVPQHVAIIMDGNGRWAERRGLPRLAGHRAGIEAVRRTVRASRSLGLSYLTLYAFSLENWRRPGGEIRGLFELLREYIRRDLDELIENNVRLRVIGRIGMLPAPVRRAVQGAVERTAEKTGQVLTVALSYGGRGEIVDAVRRIATAVERKELRPEEISEDTVADALYTAGMPDPDLLIRTSGEMRVSNFLLWQVAYTELWVTRVLWPDFGPSHLRSAVRAYARRSRRFGSLGPG